MVRLQMAGCCPLKILGWRRGVDELLLPVVLTAGGLQIEREMKEEERKVKLATLLVDLVLEFAFVQPSLFWSLPSLHQLVFALFPAAFLSYQGSPPESWQISPGAPSLSSEAAE